WHRWSCCRSIRMLRCMPRFWFSSWPGRRSIATAIDTLVRTLAPNAAFHEAHCALLDRGSGAFSQRSEWCLAWCPGGSVKHGWKTKIVETQAAAEMPPRVAQSTQLHDAEALYRLFRSAMEPH